LKDAQLIKVLDGDSVRLRVHQDIIELRLWGIDAPEYQQAFGQRAKKSLIRYCQNKALKFEVLGIDRYHRHLGILYANEININEKMLSMGLAWVYPKKQKYYRQFKALEARAIKNKKGLWKYKKRQPPWIFRKEKSQ